MANSYARGMVFRRLSEISGLDINSSTVEIVSVKPVSNKKGNTELTLRAKRDSFFKGNKVYYYDRKPICQPVVELVISIGDRKIGWTWELLDLIYAQTGVRHLKEEIVNERTFGKERVYIAFSTTHPYWLGGFYLSLTKGKEASVVVGTPQPTVKRNVTSIYDDVIFSEYESTLKGYRQGEGVSEALAGILNTKLPLDWNIRNGVSAFNLNNAKVLYNGAAAKVMAAKHKSRRLLQIALDNQSCSKAYGELMIYY